MEVFLSWHENKNLLKTTRYALYTFHGKGTHEVSVGGGLELLYDVLMKYKPLHTYVAIMANGSSPNSGCIAATNKMSN